MKPKMKIVLVAEDRYSAGRIMSIIGVGLLLFYLYMDLSKVLSDNLKAYEEYNSADWSVFFITYFVAILFILLGIVIHRKKKWPEFVEELYPDGWIRPKFIYANKPVEVVDCDIPPNLLVRIKKYKKRYSKRRKSWYIVFAYDFVYEDKAYTRRIYGWLKEPEDIKYFEKYVDFVKEQARKNTGGNPVKITFSMSGYGIYSWSELDYAKKLKEERDKLISGENEESK